MLSFYTAESHWLIMLGKYEAAHINLRKATAIVDKLPQKPHNTYRIYEEWSELMARTGDAQAALTWQQRAYRFMDPKRHNSLGIARAHSRLAKRLAAVGQTDQALEYARTSLKMRQSLAETFPSDMRARHKLAGAYLDLAHLYDLMATDVVDQVVQAQHRQEACRFYQLAQPILGQVPDVGTDRLGSRDALKRLRDVCAS